MPSAIVRRSAYIAPGVVLMPSFVNLGAYVDTGTMVDTWASVGSCAQIGKNVHLSGGVGIGGVLEPMQAGPTIIEDNCFIGARSEVVEGCIVREGSVLGMGVFIGKSTKIVDRATGEISYGEVPANSVVVAGVAARKALPERRAGPQPLLRRHRQARRCPNPVQDLDQRALERLIFATNGRTAEAQTDTDRILLPEKDKLIWLFFRFSGRVSRAAYFLAGCCSSSSRRFRSTG